ncbi:hypothetical protein [Thioflexithrix psekupsensis]|uniref:Uncharacterized protein n=1 Tax=Thioflexithrix psekupsensis TaxID=1570016 RepID=A0A251X886_9GAMM|nr:hypothetical protein [Thioflexithrix psekupsensis]OUD14216.1 hypothetical protein TPSD3_07755 [Thioflexithrix psekupsensis]
MDTFICHLNFTAPLHVDSLGTGFYQETDKFIRSDTLSAALLSTWLQLFPEDVGASNQQQREEEIKENILNTKKI